MGGSPGFVYRSIAVAAFLVGCAGGPSTPGVESSDATSSPEAVALKSGVQPTAGVSTLKPPMPPPGAHLNYYGGRLLQNPKVVQVIYGSGTYIPEVTSGTAPNMASAYGQFVSSGVFDWLGSEYDTTSPTFRLGRGTFEGVITITPTHIGALVQDSSIQAELTDQINSGVLPPPDNDRIYMIHFPRGMQISMGSGRSCVQFCAYHGTYQIGAQDVFYGVMPDIGTATCPCAYSTTFYTSQQSISSHELVEAITDAEVGLATTFAPPLAWYDPANGEIGDICAAEPVTTFVGTDTRTYTIQTEFSNATSACISNANIGNHCALNNGGCDANATCTGQTLGRTCTCNAGFTGDGVNCTDINECLTNNGGCDTNATCTNTVGSRTCACNSGFTGNGLTCSDINECLTNNGGCDAHATCANTIGSRTCACNSGFTGNGLTCSDVNECLANNGGCDVHATCMNTIGSRTCACNSGYMGNGLTCSDVNECLMNNGGCDTNATCTNTIGSRTCACNSGYMGNGFTCADVDECLTNNGGCDTNATCANTVGSNTCTCNSGFTGDGVTCTDIDECLTANGGCDTNATCTNTVGSRTCACNAGYNGDGITCVKNPDCSTANGGCDTNATCAVSGGTRTCTCNAGYSGDGLTCADVDECATDNGGCAADATCMNTPGSHTCACNTGFTGDGTTCMPSTSPSGGGCGCNTDGGGSTSTAGLIGVVALVVRRRRRNR